MIRRGGPSAAIAVRSSPSCWSLLPVSLCAVLALAGCGGPELPAEEQIRRLNTEAENAVEAKDVGALKDFIADDYADESGYDKNAVIRIAQLYLLRHKAVYVFTLTKSLVIIDENNAAAEVLAALAGQPVNSADQLFDMRADLVRFQVGYVLEDGEWLVRSVDWRRATAEDFL